MTKSLNDQWYNIFKNIPVGMVMLQEEQIVYKNHKMVELIGHKNIKVTLKNT